MTDELWAPEEGWWTMGAAEARRRMHPSCVMVLAGSVLQGEAILNGMDTAPRWDGVQMTDRHGVETEDCVVLAYRAAATCKGAAYAAAPPSPASGNSCITASRSG